MQTPDEKTMKKVEDYTFTALTESERANLEESVRHNRELMVRLAKL